ncbi:hypothetical protein H4218_004507 [Coemansia sp. IMI 209128]|nr:hypothetical protein GGI06_001515 [Coemansia sp. S85]KAJ2696596.1 hypothetical protein H4218_004507 [Coemansia sp. IMI 209128]
MRPLSEQIPSSCKRQLNSLKRTTRRIQSACSLLLEPQSLSPARGTPLVDIDYDELRETVKSAWRKRDPLEQLRIIAFVVPKDERMPSDYFALPHGNYKEAMKDVCFDTNQCVFYELESGYSSGSSDSESSTGFGSALPSSSTVFNEFVVTSSPTKASNTSCPVHLNSIVFV